MISMTRKTGKACFAVSLLFIACGGRVTDGDNGDNPGSDKGTTGPTDTPPPTCSDICRRAIDHCVPGGSIVQCTSDCEEMRTSFQGCAALDSVLRCRLTCPVTCSGNHVTLEGCTTELNELARCKP